MSHKRNLTWQPGSGRRAGRWRKCYKGQVFYFDGGRGKSDREAYKAALQDWEKKKAEFDAKEECPHELDYAEVISEWEAVQNWSVQNDDREIANLARKKIKQLRLRLMRRDPTPIKRVDRFLSRFDPPELTLPPEFGPNLALDPNAPGVVDPRRFQDELNGSPTRIAKEVWLDRIASQFRGQVAKAETVSAAASDFLAHKKEQVDVGELTAGRYGNLVNHVSQFEGYIGGPNPVTRINARVLQSYRTALLQQVKDGVFGRSHARGRFEACRQFIRWLWKSDILPSLPKNIDDKGLRITVPIKSVKAYTISEIRRLLDGADERMKLYILLSLNTAMTQVDISELRHAEIDWRRRRVTRTRTKIARHENAPTVTYKLWSETTKLLKKHRSSGDDRVLLNENGQPLKVERLRDDGGVLKIDNIGRAFHRLCCRLNLKGANFKRLRKTSPSLMVPKFAGLRTLFLGNSPKDITDRHYTDPPIDALDDVIAWLGKQYGIQQ